MTALLCEPPVRALTHYLDTAAMRERWRERLPALLGTSSEVTGFRCASNQMEIDGGVPSPTPRI